MRVQHSLAFAFVLALVVGCSPPPPCEVSGTVTVDGAPAGLTTVKFMCEADPTKNGMVLTKDDGTFTVPLKDGEYKVTFSQTVNKGGKAIMGGGGKKAEATPGERENMPDEVRDAATSPHAVSAKAGQKQTVTFDVKKGAKK